LKHLCHWLIIVALLLIAFGMRLYRLEELPPGLFHDEAYNTLDAKALAEGQPHPRFYDSWEVYARTVHPDWPPEQTRFPVFLEGNYGREALFHYLGAIVIAIVGPKVWALRLVSASMGVLTVAVAYRITRELFTSEPTRAARMALLASAVTTGLYSLLAFSRLGLRIIMLVPLSGMTVALWWRATRERELRWWISAGLLLGLTQYTYIPSRLLVVIVAYPVILRIVRQPKDRPGLIRGASISGAAMLLVTVPLIVFFVRYPAYLTLRAEAIAADAPEHGLSMMFANVWRVLWGLIRDGDPNPILNLPGRPTLDVVQVTFFVVGTVLCLRRVQQFAYPFLLIWAGMMHSPSIVSGVAPTFGRSIGGMLPVTIIVAVGMEAIWSFFVERWSHVRPWITTALEISLLFSIGLTAYDYFIVWAQWPNLPDIFHAARAEIGQYIGALPQDTVVYITPSQKYYATMLLAMGAREPPHDFYGPTGLLPAGDPNREAVYLILEGDEMTANRLETTFPNGWWDKHREVSAYRVPPTDARAHPEQPCQAEFNSLIQLLGFDASLTNVRPGDTLSIQLTWQALATMERRYTAFVHLVGPDTPATGSPLWAQDDHEPGYATYATDRWFQREVVMDTFTLQVPADAIFGTYTLTTGFYDRETMARLPRSDITGDTATLTTFTIDP
jgi:4-amino-4-deoxy-L-arabinose transferase-like glycosyltransferase